MALRLFRPRIALRTSRHVVLYAALMALLPAIAVAQLTPATYQAKLSTVAEVGSRFYSSEQVATLSGLQIGSSVDRSAIQAAADRLAGSGLFSAVRYRFSTGADGLTITFELEDAPAFPISLDNIPWLTDADLTTALNQAGLPIGRTAPASGAMDGRIAQVLQKALGAKGIQATVSYAVATVPGSDDRVLQFKATGADLRVTSLQFTDRLATRDPGIQDLLPTITGNPYSLEALERFDFEHVRPLYFAHAYLRVKFSAPDIRFSHSGAVAVTIPIDPGPAYAWGGVMWNGNHAYTTSDLDALVNGAGLVSGQPVDGNKIFAMWQSVRAAYGHRGYIDATVVPKETFDDTAHRAAYQVNISEGDQYHMGNLVLTGLSIDSEKRLRDAWRIAQGQVFDQTYCNYFISQGIAEALKGLPAGQDTVGHYLQKNAQQKTVDVMIDFQ